MHCELLFSSLLLVELTLTLPPFLLDPARNHRHGSDREICRQPYAALWNESYLHQTVASASGRFVSFPVLHLSFLLERDS